MRCARYIGRAPRACSQRTHVMETLVLAVLVACQAAPLWSRSPPPLPTALPAPAPDHIPRRHSDLSASDEVYWPTRDPHNTDIPYYSTDRKLWNEFPKKKHLVEIVPLQNKSLVKGKGKKLAYILPNPNIVKSKALKHQIYDSATHDYDSSEESEYDTHLKESDSNSESLEYSSEHEDLKLKPAPKHRDDSDEVIRNKIDELVRYFKKKNKIIDTKADDRSVDDNDAFHVHYIVHKNRRNKRIDVNEPLASNNEYNHHVTDFDENSIPLIPAVGQDHDHHDHISDHEHKPNIKSRDFDVDDLSHIFNDLRENHQTNAEVKHNSHHIPNSHHLIPDDQMHLPFYENTPIQVLQIKSNSQEDEIGKPSNSIINYGLHDFRNVHGTAVNLPSNEDIDSEQIEPDDVEDSSSIVSQEQDSYISVDESDVDSDTDASDESKASSDDRSDEESIISISSSKIESESASASDTSSSSDGSDSQELRAETEPLNSPDVEFPDDVFSPAIYISSVPEYDASGQLLNFLDADTFKGKANTEELIAELSQLIDTHTKLEEVEPHEQLHYILDPNEHAHHNNHDHEHSHHIPEANEQRHHIEHQHGHHSAPHEHVSHISQFEEHDTWVSNEEPQYIPHEVLESNENGPYVIAENIPNLESDEEIDVLKSREVFNPLVLDSHEHASHILESNEVHKIESLEDSDSQEVINLSALIPQKIRVGSDCDSKRKGSCGHKSYKLTFLFNR